MIWIFIGYLLVTLPLAHAIGVGIARGQGNNDGKQREDDARRQARPGRTDDATRD